jgi:VanZ family protein
MALIFALSSRPIPEGVAFMPDWLTHGGAWLVLAVLAYRALDPAGSASWSMAVLCVVLCTAYGVTDELHQSLVPGRVADAWDVMMDFAGSVAGTVLARALLRPTRLEGETAA